MKQKDQFWYGLGWGVGLSFLAYYIIFPYLQALMVGYIWWQATR
jgi:hypothetical protein